MNNFQEGFKKKIFLGMGLLLIFIFLIFGFLNNKFKTAL